MLFFVFLYYLFQSAFIDASPVPSVNDRSLAGNHCTDLTRCRTIWSIVWSCLATIFSCTWVAVHPNIPCPKKREANSWIGRCIWNPLLSFAEHRLPLFVCALLVPEYILAWAIRQFLSARKIAKDNKSEFKTLGYIATILSNSFLEQRWSMTHGFFIIMGGFHLFERSSEEAVNNNRGMSQEDDIPLHPLQASDLVRFDGYSESFFIPTEAEIKDKGKSDWLAKSLVLLQTSWFVMQCIARAIEHLPVTHLEIVTLAYSAMNFVIYIFWWNKPLNVNRPVRVLQKSVAGETRLEPTPEEWELTSEAIGNGLETIFKFIAGFRDKDVNLSHEDRVPMFWANNTNSEELGLGNLIMLLVGICFGAIHCIAWHFSLPTHAELLMWRISSVAITVVPINIFWGFILGSYSMNYTVEIILILPHVTLYILARAVTLVLAFISLKDLPPGAYETVYWTTFIPHI